MSSSIYAYYKLPRISRTPSPPKEYLRRRQEMGGASLPPLPEDENYNTDQPRSHLSSPDYEAARPKKKRKSSSLRIKQRVKGGPVDWSRVFSDGEDGGEILDSIVVRGGVLSTALNAAWSPDTKKTKVVSQKIKSREQNIVEAPIDRVLEQHDHDAHIPAMVVAPGHAGQSPQRIKQYQTPPTTKKTVKYVKPYPNSPLHVMRRSIAPKAKTPQPESQDYVLLTQGTLGQPAASPTGPQMQQEQPDSMDENDSRHNRTSPCASSVSFTAESSPITSDLADSIRHSTRQPVLTSKVHEAQRSPSPSHLTLLVSRTDANPSSTVRPFKIAGDEFIKGGRWMWLQLISIIKDRTHFDPSQDEILLNWITPLPDIDMLRDQQKEMKRMGNNEIVVVRTTKEGYWPEWMYERIKEKKRQVRRERERERLEKEREARRRKILSEESIPLAGKTDDILPVVVFEDLPAPTAVNGAGGRGDDTVDTVAVYGESTPSVLDKPIEDSSSKPAREKFFTLKLRGSREITTSPPLEDEAVAPEIPEAQESSDTISSVENFIGDNRIEGMRLVMFTSLNQVPDLEHSEDFNPTPVGSSTTEKFLTLPLPTVSIPLTPPVTLPLPRPTVPAVPTTQTIIIESVPRVQSERIATNVSAEFCTPIPPAVPTPPLALSLPPRLPPLLPAPLVPASVSPSVSESLASALPASATPAPSPSPLPPVSAAPAPSQVPPTSPLVPPPVPPSLVQPGQTPALVSAAHVSATAPPVAGGVAVAKYPPRPPPTFLGRTIPMPQPYKRPANMPPRSSLGFSPLTGIYPPTTHTKTGSAMVPAPMTVSPSIIPSSSTPLPILRVALPQDANVLIKNPSPKHGATAAFPCHVKSNNGSVELSPAAAAVASGPLAKWLSKQGGPTVKPRAVANYVVPRPGPPGKKRGRPVTRKSMPTATGELVTPVMSQTRPAPPTRTEIPTSSLPSSLPQFIPMPSLLTSRTLSTLPSCPSTSSGFSTTPPHIDNKGLTTAPASAPSVTTNASCTPSAPCATPASVLHIPSAPPVPSASPAVSASSALSASPSTSAPLGPTLPAPSSSRSVNQPPSLITQTETSTSVSPASLSTIESSFQDTDNSPITVTDSIAPCTTATQTPTCLHQYNHGPGSDLDLNLDLHLHPRPRKETRVPSWVKSKTPVSKSRLSGAGVLGRFEPGKSPTTGPTQSTVFTMRPVSGIDEDSGGGVRDESMSLSMQIKDGDGPMGNGDDLDMGLGLHRGVKRPRASVCLYSSKRRPSGLDSNLTEAPPGQNVVGGFGLIVGKMKSQSKRVGRDVSHFGEAGGGDEEFLSWGDGGARNLGVDGESFSRGRGEEDDGKDLELGF